MATSLPDAPKLRMSVTLLWPERVRYVDDEPVVGIVRRPVFMAHDQDSYDGAEIKWHDAMGSGGTILPVTTYATHLQGGAAYSF